MGGMNSRQSRLPVVLVAVVLTLPILYVLSAGPLVWLFTRHYIDSDSLLGRCLVGLYWPVMWLGRHSDWFKHVWDWYLDFWEAA
jgi:hypothetical protein